MLTRMLVFGRGFSSVLDILLSMITGAAMSFGRRSFYRTINRYTERTRDERRIRLSQSKDTQRKSLLTSSNSSSLPVVSEDEMVLVKEVPGSILQNVESSQDVGNLARRKSSSDGSSTSSYSDRDLVDEHFHVPSQPAQKSSDSALNIHSEESCNTGREEGHVSSCIKEYAELEW